MSFVDDLFLKILVQTLSEIVTPESVKQAETYVMAALATLAKNTASKVDDALVKVVSDALGVSVA